MPHQESSSRAFKQVALHSILDISIMYTLFSRNSENIHALDCLSKTLHARSSKTTLKRLSQSWLTLKRLCLRPSTKTTFSIKGDVPSLTLPIPMIFPLASSPKVTCHLHVIFIGLQSCWYPKNVPWAITIKIPLLPTSLVFGMYLHHLTKLLTLVPKLSWVLEC